MPELPVVSKSMLHFYEEPCLVGTNSSNAKYGAGAVFFAGCNLKCVFCQNGLISGSAPPEISDAVHCDAVGRDSARNRSRMRGNICTVEELSVIFRAQGAACIDLVTPTHFTNTIREALHSTSLEIPVVWNSGGYEKTESLRTLSGLVQIYMPDLKYALPELAERYSRARDYFTCATAAIKEMFAQVGRYKIDSEGQLRSGVIIRHLMLPGEIENTRRVIDWIAQNFKPGDVLFSLLRQYTPQVWSQGSLSRRVTGAEYRAAVAYMQNCGIHEGYIQDSDSANSLYTPDFSV